MVDLKVRKIYLKEMISATVFIMSWEEQGPEGNWMRDV